MLLYIILYYFISCCGKKETEESPEGRNEVFFISIPDPPSHEPGLPSYEELKTLESPPSYWSLYPYKIYYDKIITETL